MLNAKMSVDKIAAEIGRHRSTVFREIRRNFYRDVELPELKGYHAVTAQDRFERRRATHRKLIQHPKVMAAVRDGLDAGWSPEQIAGRRHRRKCFGPIDGATGLLLIR
jgi:IS30 family transposase